MLDERNESLLIDIARNQDTPPSNRVSAVALCYKTGALAAKECIEILQETIGDSRTKCGVQVKALELLDKIDDTTGQEPELDSECIDDTKKKLMEKFLKCRT